MDREIGETKNRNYVFFRRNPLSKNISFRLKKNFYPLSCDQCQKLVMTGYLLMRGKKSGRERLAETMWTEGNRVSSVTPAKMHC